MNAHDALAEIREMIERQGPDQPNRHLGRKQYESLMNGCDEIEAALAVTDSRDSEDGDLQRYLSMVAELPIEDEEDTDVLSVAWLTADDITSRLRDRLKALNYWWVP